MHRVGVGRLSSYENCVAIPRRGRSWHPLSGARREETPKKRELAAAGEYSSDNIRRLGSISKRGDSYLRMMLVHGGRAVLYSEAAAVRAGRPLDALRAWGMRIRDKRGYNKAAVAVANKLARILWATWRYQRDFESRPPSLVAA